MPCPTCSHTMQGLGVVESGARWFHCPRCGTLRSVNPNGREEDSVPYAVSRLPANDDAFSALDVAVALSLYAYNVDRFTRAQKLYDHFQGECLELRDLVDILDGRQAYAATELPAPTAEVYVSHALSRYGAEAKHRNRANLSPVPE